MHRELKYPLLAAFLIQATGWALFSKIPVSNNCQKNCGTGPSPVERFACSVCHLTNVRTGALLSASPTAGDCPSELGYHREAFMKLRFLTTVALLSLAAWPAAAQPSPPGPTTLETLGAMHQTGSTADWPEVPQTGQKADQVKQNLSKIKLPPGFHISLYALVPDARHIAVGPQGVATFVGTRKSKVWVVTDRSRGGVGDEVKEFAPTLPKKIPNGACFSKDGFLYTIEQN
jgi:hypothetical protein